MAYRNGNYCAFYVAEPFSESNLGAHAQRDFVYYNLLRAWKTMDPTFPFVNSHDKTYSVRDGSDWEATLKPRIRERLRNSKNIILFLSSCTVSSRALREEIEYGIKDQGLPVIVVYPEYKEKSDIIECESKNFRSEITTLWDNLPVFRDSMDLVPTLHIPMKKELVKKALEDSDFTVGAAAEAGRYFFPC